MLPSDLTKDIKTRLSTIRGQVDGIIKMLENEQDPEKIITQLKAVESGLDTAHNLLLDEVYRKALAIKIVEAANACPGNCGNEEKIEFLRTEFPQFKLDDIVHKLKKSIFLWRGLWMSNLQTRFCKKLELITLN